MTDGSLHEGGALEAFWLRWGRLHGISSTSVSMRLLANVGPYQYENREFTVEDYMYDEPPETS